MPIERAVPSTMRMAASMSFALRSGSLICAISLTCERDTVPTLILFGSPEPLASLAARFSSTAAGGVFSTNVNVRSEKIEITAGMIRPCCSAVRALNALQNSMMFTPCWPSAGPTGGAGFAAPAGHCSFTIAISFLAILRASDLLYVLVREPNGRRTPDNRHQHLDLFLLGPHFTDDAREARKRAVNHAHVFPFLERDNGLGLARLALAEHAADVVLWDRGGLGAGAHESAYLGSVLDDVPELVVELHLHEQVSGQEFALAGAPLPLHHLDHVLFGDDDLFDRTLAAELLHALLKRLLRPSLLAGERVDHVPRRRHYALLPFAS